MKNKEGSLSSKKLRKLIVSYFSLSYIIFTIFISAFFLITAKGLIKESTIKDLNHRIELRKLLVEEWLRKSKDISRQIASRTMIRKKLESFNNNLISYNEIKKYTEPKLKDAISNVKEISGIYRLSKKNELVASLSRIEFDRIKNFINLNSMKLVIHNPVKIKNEFYILVNSPIKNKMNEIVGRDIILINLYKLNGILKKDIFKEKKENFLLSYEDNDKIIFFTNTEKLSENIKKVINDIQKSKISLKNNLINYKKHYILSIKIDEGIGWKLFLIIQKENLTYLIIKTFIPKFILPLFLLLIIILVFLLLTKPLTEKILLKTEELEKIVQQKTNSLKKEIDEKNELERKNKDLVFLKNAILESPQGIVVFALDKDYRYLDFTLLHKQTMKAIWGVDIEVGKSMLDYIKNEDDRKKAKKNFDRALKGENFVLVEEYGDEALKRNYYENRYNPIYDKNKNIIGLSVFVIDVTEQKRIENELRNSEERFKTLFNGINHSVLVHILQEKGFSKFIEVNKTACEVYGYTREEFLEITPKEISSLTDVEKRGSAEYRKELLEKKHAVFEATHITKDGRRFPVEISSNIFNWMGKNVIVSIITDITEKKKAEQELRESEEYNKVLFHSSLIPLVVMDSKTFKFLDCNQAAINIYGFKTREEVLGKTPADVSTPTQYNGVSSELAAKEKIEKALKKDKVIFEWRHQRPDGSIWDAEVQLMKFTFKNHSYLLFSLLDITERKRILQQLTESEERYRTAFKTMPESITISSLDGTYIDVNDGFMNITNYKREEVIGKSTIKLNIWKNKDKRDEFLNILKEKGYVDNFEAEFLTKDKRSIIGLISANLIKVNQKPAILTITRDITQRREVEKEILKEREKLSVTLRSIGDGVITTDVNGNIDFLNKTAERLTEWRTEEARGKSLEEVFKIVNEITRQKVRNPVKRVLSEGRIVGLANHTILISKTGKEYNIADSAAPIFDIQSNIIGVVLVFRDVTEKLRLEEEQLKLKKLESIGILAGGIAHDFNNILTGLFGNLELARLKLSNNDPAFGYVQTAFSALDRATKLTKQLLTFAKGGEPILENVDVKGIIKSNVEFNLSGSKIKPVFNLPDDIWEVVADKGQISQVISNLIINSKQAMPDGGRIYISAKNINSIEDEGISHYKGRYVLITIKDEGIGISQKHIEKIFDPYFSTKQQGSGLGLAIVHSIISKHNGYISVESSIGKGTTFYIYLPASKSKKQNIEKQKKSKSKNKKNDINILLMDDEEIIRDVATSMLNLLGYNVELAVNGEEAIEKYKAFMEKGKKFDLVIMDLTVPGGIGGKEAIKEMKKIDSSIKAIVSSGYSTDPIMSNYKKYGFEGKLLKPFQLSEVEEEIEKILNIK